MKIVRMTLIIIVAIVVVLGIVTVIIIDHPSFGKASHGERLERLKLSPDYRDGQFRNLILTQRLTSDKGKFAATQVFTEWWKEGE
ncbi:hypothetical protein DMB45_13515 [Sanguibacteroides justesenii]|uniref:Uncharacterized protein n=2 Tax=Porphyromonadaceae TaxID=171551 RepID=A0A0C3NFT9_9PORP|nr:hypothetical protein IE90_13930 [Sanguibacteroides justesenii]KIO45002.1 hypothetical protein BA92_08325 [Sanguibacteroides justesenii]PXZ42839.1 hypothetical protein DMB45_13515 [Sanguibacteroides justesenii]